MAHEKITLDATKLFIIRETRTHPDGKTSVRYYETPSVWNKSPAMATIFRDYDMGMGHLTMFQERDLKGIKSWADGSACVYDVVPLYGEILQSPNGTSITPKDLLK